MKTRPEYLFPFIFLLTPAFLFSCERMPDAQRAQLLEQQRRDSLIVVARKDSLLRDSVAQVEKLRAEKEAANARPQNVNEALRGDARLARTMSLEKFSRYMKSRQSYYRQFKDVSYEDEFVKIKMEGDELKVETPKGKAKFEEGEAKIKTDTYKRKTETD